MVEKGALVISDGLVKWVRPEKELPVEYGGLPEKNFEGRPITPALDCAREKGLNLPGIMDAAQA